MSVIQVWISAVLLGVLMLHGAQSQMCEEPWQAAFMQLTNTTYTANVDSLLDPNLVFFRQILRFTEDEIDREREDAISFFNQQYGLDFSNIEPDEQGQRILGNATFRPIILPFNSTLVQNRWLVSGNSRTKCYLMREGGFYVRFSGIVRLHGEYGGEEGLIAFLNEGVLYGRNYIYDACSQQGILFQTESLTPVRLEPTDGWIVLSYRIRNRQLGEGNIWGIARVTQISPTTRRFEGRLVYTFP